MVRNINISYIFIYIYLYFIELFQALLITAANGRSMILRSLLESGPISKEARSQATIAAYVNGHHDVVTSLLANGPIPKEYRNIATMFAAERGNIPIVKLLLIRGSIAKFFRMGTISKAARFFAVRLARHGSHGEIEKILNESGPTKHTPKKMIALEKNYIELKQTISIILQSKQPAAPHPAHPRN